MLPSPAWMPPKGCKKQKVGPAKRDKARHTYKNPANTCTHTPTHAYFNTDTAAEGYIAYPSHTHTCTAQHIHIAERKSNNNNV